MDGVSEHHVYIELDCLLDVRANILEHCFGHMGQQIIESPLYRKRLNDDFRHIVTDFPQQDYIDTYRHRTYEMVAGAKLTEVGVRLQDFILNARLEKESHAGICKIFIHLNTYPYCIDRTTTDLFRNHIRKHYYVDEVRMMNLDPHHLHIRNIAEGGQFFMYDIDGWLNESMIKSLKESPSPSTEIVTPFILKKDTGVSVKEAVEHIERAMQYMCSLKILPLSMFSVNKE